MQNEVRFPNIGQTTLWDLEKQCGCCLGHVLHQAHGRSYKELNHKRTPMSISNTSGKKNPLTKKAKVGDGILFSPTSLTNKAMTTNDEPRSINKEAELIDLFKANGYNITFVD